MAASATVNRAIARRLLAEVAGARGYLAAAGLIGLVVTGLILAQAQLLAHLLAGAATGAAAAALRGTLLVLLGVVVARAAAAYAGETAALRGAAVIKERLRSRLAGHVLGLGPAWLGSERPGEIGTLGTSGLDSLDPALGAADLALERVQRANDLLARLDRRSATASGLGVSLASLTAGLTLWGVLLVGVTAVGAGVLSRVPLAVLALTALAAFEAVTALPAAAVQLSHARTAATRIAEVMDASPAVTDPQEPLPLPDAAATARGVSVRMRDAKVRYRPDCPLAVDGVSLDLTPGRRLALVGPSGAGKSTVAAVLFRFQELAGGCVTMDGHDLAGYRAQDVRSLIGGCPQDPHLFNASIAENLRLARPEAPDAALTAMIDRVGLAPWIAGLPHGMDTQVGFGGAAVSGGQRQRIALARALLADPAVLILDEPTAHVDQESRRALAADLLAITVGRSVLLITHDLDGLDQVDEIILLDRGRVVERGAHAWLLANRGLYWRLHGAQFSGWS